MWRTGALVEQAGDPFNTLAELVAQRGELPRERWECAWCGRCYLRPELSPNAAAVCVCGQLAWRVVALSYQIVASRRASARSGELKK